MAKGVVVIDPGHGGSLDAGGSSKNNAVSPSGVLEKNMTLGFAFLVRESLLELAKAADQKIKVFLTRETDTNIGLAARASFAKEKEADIFLSIHFNGFNGVARGTETLVSPKAINSNHEADTTLAKAVQSATFNALKALDANAKDRGVKDQKLGVLNEKSLGKTARACLLEVEFTDVREVDTLINIGADAPRARVAICKAIAGALLANLIANPRARKSKRRKRRQ